MRSNEGVYARFKAGGKLVWRSRETNVQLVAVRRFRDLQTSALILSDQVHSDFPRVGSVTEARERSSEAQQESGWRHPPQA